MGSGLILLVIVAAWLAVLVPMALRSSDSADSLSSVDRFSDAMRVLSRRDAAARARANAVAGSARLGADEDDVGDDVEDEYDDDLLDEWDERDGALTRVRAVLADRVLHPVATVAARARRRSGRPLTPAARRRRLLAVLLVLAASTLVLGLVVSPLLLAGHAVADLLVVGYLVALRRLVRQRQAAQRRARGVPAARREPGPPAAEQRVEPRAEMRVEPGDVEEPVAYAATGTDGAPAAPAAAPPGEPQPAEPVPTAARHDEPLPASAGLGAPWSPVPVPPPVYASAPVVPRYSRTVDLTRPGAYSEAAASGERLPGMEDEPPQTERAAEPRRVVNDW
ncbi:MAG TPA: hypothetical protein VNU26_18365 [Mycobacteriales bacterium]|nr:hypothetical protein [Mycobacteriales bacterium]